MWHLFHTSGVLLGGSQTVFKTFLFVWWLGVGAVVAGTGRGQLEGLNGEGKVVIIGVVDEEAVVDVLLETLGLVALGHQRAAFASSGALLYTGSLGQGLVVRLHLVDDNPPLTVDVDGPLGLDVSRLRGAQVSLLDDLLQPSNRVVGVGQHILVHLLDGVVVVLDSLLDLVGGVLFVLQAPGLGVTLGALGWGVVVGFGVMWGRGRCVRGRCVVDWGVVNRGVVYRDMVNWGHGVDSWVVRSIGGLGVGNIRSWLRVIWCWLRDVGCVHWLGVHVGGGRGGVPVGRRGWGVAIGGRGVGLSLGSSLCSGARHHQRCQCHETLHAC